MENKIPEFLHNILYDSYERDIVEQIIDGYTKTRKTTLRVNNLKANINEIMQKLENIGITFKRVQWYEDSLIIQERENYDIRKSEMYKNGQIYLQSLSSMIPPIILSPQEGESILDMAAAPGGKTTQMTSLSNNQAMITACEKNKIRAERLKYNLEKQGAGRVNVMMQDARKLDDFFSFDKILLDAPCSGSGTININEKMFITKELIDRSIKIQKELLKKALNIVKDKGEIIYSTCSVLKEENENILQEVLNKNNVEIVPIDTNLFEGVPMLPVNIPGTICVCPSELYEGFFVAKIMKKI